MQISLGLDHEVSISNPSRGRGITCAGVVAGDRPKPGNDDLCRVDKPGACAHADRDSTADLGVEGSAVLEGEKLA